MLSILINNFKNITRRDARVGNHLGKHWSSDAGFDKNIERRNYDFEEATAPTRELCEQILTKFQQKPKAERQEFIDRVTSDSLLFLAERRKLRVRQIEKMAVCHESMTLLVRRVFDALELFSIELNSRVGFSELQTAVTRPSHVKEIVRYSKQRQPLETVTNFRARMTTSSWSLVLRGRHDRIDIFLLPVNRAIGLTKAEASFEPIATIKGEFTENDDIMWILDESRILDDSSEEDLCKELFLTLINHTKAQLDERDEFESYAV